MGEPGHYWSYITHWSERERMSGWRKEEKKHEPYTWNFAWT
jgi:hypothetical protein